MVRLRVEDIHGQRMLLHVRQGKGHKHRHTLLSERLLGELRACWRVTRPQPWLFPNRTATGPMPRATVQKAFYAMKKRTGIRRGQGIPCLGHSFATHLLEAGVDLPTTVLALWMYLPVAQRPGTHRNRLRRNALAQRSTNELSTRSVWSSKGRLCAERHRQPLQTWPGELFLQAQASRNEFDDDFRPPPARQNTPHRPARLIDARRSSAAQFNNVLSPIAARRAIKRYSLC